MQKVTLETSLEEPEDQTPLPPRSRAPFPEKAMCRKHESQYDIHVAKTMLEQLSVAQANDETIILLIAYVKVELWRWRREGGREGGGGRGREGGRNRTEKQYLHQGVRNKHRTQTPAGDDAGGDASGDIADETTTVMTSNNDNDKQPRWPTTTMTTLPRQQLW